MHSKAMVSSVSPERGHANQNSNSHGCAHKDLPLAQKLLVAYSCLGKETIFL